MVVKYERKIRFKITVKSKDFESYCRPFTFIDEIDVVQDKASTDLISNAFRQVPFGAYLEVAKEAFNFTKTCDGFGSEMDIRIQVNSIVFSEPKLGIKVDIGPDEGEVLKPNKDINLDTVIFGS